jgi:hypothetical protein
MKLNLHKIEMLCLCPQIYDRSNKLLADSYINILENIKYFRYTDNYNYIENIKRICMYLINVDKDFQEILNLIN